MPDLCGDMMADRSSWSLIFLLTGWRVSRIFHLHTAMMHDMEFIQFIFEFIAQRNETTIIRKSQAWIQHKWAHLLEQQLFITVYCLLAGENNHLFSVSYLIPFSFASVCGNQMVFFVFVCFCLQQTKTKNSFIHVPFASVGGTKTVLSVCGKQTVYSVFRFHNIQGKST